MVFISTVGDDSNWPVTQGREAELKPKVQALADDRGIEIRFMNCEYEHVPDDPECMTALAEHFLLSLRDRTEPMCDSQGYQWITINTKTAAAGSIS